MTELGSADAFDRMGTLGVEEEFYIVDADGRPISGIDGLVYGPEPPEPFAERLDHELFQFTIETQTPLVEDPDEASTVVSMVREALVDHAAAHGYYIVTAGFHPATKWRELDHATKPRYQTQLGRVQYPQHRNTTVNLHVHVGVDDAGEAVWVANELRWYLAPPLALSANFPFWNSFDIDLASARAKVFENLPNTGMPTAFDGFEESQRFERRMVEHDSVDDRGEPWYDVCPHAGHGTVEIRTLDVQTDPERVTDFIGYIHALVLDLTDRYEAGEPGASVRRELLDENEWRVTRYSRNTDFIAPDSEGVVSLVSSVRTESDRLGVDGLRLLLDAKSGAAAQQRIHEESGLDDLCEHLTLN